MRLWLAISATALVAALAQPSLAQDDGPPVPIEQAPYHLPAFTNEYITLLNVTVPPGKNTGYHIHSNDSVSYTQIMDNERVRGWRLALEPGQSAPAITQSAPGVRIVLDGGEIAEAVPGVRDRGMWFKHADVFWQDAGVTRSVRNIGTTRVEFLEFELK